MTAVLFIASFALGCAFAIWGNRYRKRGLRFPSRYGGTTSPWQIIFCGGLLIVLSLFVLVYGVFD